MASEITGLGISLKIGDGAGTEAFTAVVGVKSLGWSGIKSEVLEVSDLSDDWRRFIAGIKDGGEISVGVNFRPTEVTQGNQAGGVLKDLVDGTVRNFQMVFSDTGGTDWAFSGIVQSFDLEGIDIDGIVEGSFSIKVSGQPTLASS